METQFSKGDLVVARVAAQGMVLGAQYKVVSVYPNQTPFGLFVAYELKAKGGKKFTVSNLHVLATKVRVLKLRKKMVTVEKPRCQLCGATFGVDECGGCSTEERRVYVCDRCKGEHICLEPRPGDHRRNP